MSCLIVIPARMASTRFPGKPLVDLGGKPMIQWVYEAAVASSVSGRVVIATPDDEILAAAEKFGAEAVRTRLDHPSGTDRLAEVALAHPADIYVNVQGDEPLIDPDSIRACAAPLLADDQSQMASLYTDCPESEIDNPNVVKVVVAANGNGLYFSRHAIPYPRNERVLPVYQHIGLYAFRRDVLLAFSSWEPTPLERTESLEQLRFLENGVQIRMARGRPTQAIDTPEQAEFVRHEMKRRELESGKR